jgi:hypothetical protein
MGQIQRPARGFYALPSPDPIFPSKPTAATTALSEDAELEQWTQMVIADMKTNKAKASENPSPTASPFPSFNPRMLHLLQAIEADPILGPELLYDDPTPQLNPTAATTFTPDHDSIIQLNATAATTPTPDPESPTQLNATAATTPTPDPESPMQLNATAATTPTIEPPNQLNATAATTFIPDPHLTSHLSPADAAVYNQVLERNWRMTYMDDPAHHHPSQQLPSHKSFWNVDYGD